MKILEAHATGLEPTHPSLVPQQEGNACEGNSHPRECIHTQHSVPLPRSTTASETRIAAQHRTHSDSLGPERSRPQPGGKAWISLALFRPPGPSPGPLPPCSEGPSDMGSLCEARGIAMPRFKSPIPTSHPKARVSFVSSLYLSSLFIPSRPSPASRAFCVRRSFLLSFFLLGSSSVLPRAGPRSLISKAHSLSGSSQSVLPSIRLLPAANRLRTGFPSARAF